MRFEFEQAHYQWALYYEGSEVTPPLVNQPQRTLHFRPADREVRAHGPPRGPS